MHKEASLHDSTFFFVGPFDDTTFCRGSQVLRPINSCLVTTHIPTASKTSALTASSVADHMSSDRYDDYAVLGDDDEYSEDELPRSPTRRHSGAMSISEEDLPFCYDREALRRDTAAHRARHQRGGSPPSLAAQAHAGRRDHAGTFAAHEQWDTELDGPSMGLWVPRGESGDRKRRRTEKSSIVPVASNSPKKAVLSQCHSSEMQGPMMALWGV